MKNINKLTNGLDSENSIFLSQIKGLDAKLHQKYDNSDSIIAELFRRADEKMHQRYPCLEPEDTHDYSQDYLTFVALEDGTFTFSENALQYSMDDGATWNTLASNTASPTVTAGNKIMWKQTGLTPSYSSGIGKFSSTGLFNVEGNIMSLLYGDDFKNQTSLNGKNFAFLSLFNGNTNVVSAENLALPATTLASSCYAYMFSDCTSLTTAPELLATTLASWCYADMFRGCTSLTTAPELPATTLISNCYNYMFASCTSLNYIKCLATDISAINCLANWVSNVSSTGAFVKAASMTDWTTGSDGVPTGWTVQTES